MKSGNSGDNWYVVKSKPQRETAATDLLERAGYETYFPEMQGAKGLKPLFPTYFFIHADLSDAATFRMIKYTRGVSGVLGDYEGPQPINEEIVTALKENIRDGGVIEQKLLINEGDQVRVRRGILKDLIGIAEKHLPEEKRVQVLFRWWSTCMRAKVRYTHLERAA